MAEDWLGRWREGRIGWHEADGNAALKKHWPEMPEGTRVLVPLCGKAPDLIWLSKRGLDVTGVELSPIACEAFFEEQAIEFTLTNENSLPCYAAIDVRLRIYCGDFFAYHEAPFDALFDRGSLVAFPENERERYVSHMRSLLKEDGWQLLLTLEYDQSAADGPPWSVPADEVRRHWPQLRRISERNDIDNGPPKFRKAGLTEFIEVVWQSR